MRACVHVCACMCACVCTCMSEVHNCFMAACEKNLSSESERKKMALIYIAVICQLVICCHFLLHLSALRKDCSIMLYTIVSRSLLYSCDSVSAPYSLSLLGVPSGARLYPP